MEAAVEAKRTQLAQLAAENAELKTEQVTWGSSSPSFINPEV